MRIGELLALRWRVVDFEAGTLHIRESVFKDQFQTPKTLPTCMSLTTRALTARMERFADWSLTGMIDARTGICVSTLAT
jgi:integrase